LRASRCRWDSFFVAVAVSGACACALHFLALMIFIGLLLCMHKVTGAAAFVAQETALPIFFFQVALKAFC
jgi:hypothetical protein